MPPQNGNMSSWVPYDLNTTVCGTERSHSQENLQKFQMNCTDDSWLINSADNCGNFYENPYAMDQTQAFDFAYSYIPQQDYSFCGTQYMQNTFCPKFSSRETTEATPREKRKRRRIISPTQRVAANLRERRRMVNLNDAYDGLRTLLPTFSHEKNLSRVHTLKLAVDYIAFMKDMLTAESSSQSASEEENSCDVPDLDLANIPSPQSEKML